MRILLIIFSLIMLNGCMSLLTPSDWDNLNKKLEDVGMTQEQRDEQIAEWKAQEAKQAQNLFELEKGIKDLVIDIGGTLAGLPENVRESTKDWSDELMKWLIIATGGGGGLALANIGRKKLINSPEGKLLGPATVKPTEPVVDSPPDPEAIQSALLDLYERIKTTQKPKKPSG